MKTAKTFSILLIVLLLITQNLVSAAGFFEPEMRLASEPKTGKLNSSFSTTRRVNLPYFEDSFSWARTAIFWFGKNELSLPGKNYVDVRMGYTDAALKIRATVIDYYLWYNNNATTTSDLTQYNAIAIYLDTHHDQAGTPQADDYKFLLGLSNLQTTANYKRDYRGDSSEWDDNWSDTWDGLSGYEISGNPYPGWPNNNDGNSIE